MYNLNGFLIRPERVSLISPVKQVPGQAEFAFRVVLDGGYEHVAMSSSYEIAVRSRSALIAACCGNEERAPMPPAAVYAAPPAKPAPAAPSRRESTPPSKGGAGKPPRTAQRRGN